MNLFDGEKLKVIYEGKNLQIDHYIIFVTHTYTLMLWVGKDYGSEEGWEYDSNYLIHMNNV